MGFNCLKAAGALPADSLLFTTKTPGDSGTHFSDLQEFLAPVLAISRGWNAVFVYQKLSPAWVSDFFYKLIQMHDYKNTDSRTPRLSINIAK